MRTLQIKDSAAYVFDTAQVAAPATWWGRRSSGRCVAWAQRTADGWRVRHIENDRTWRAPNADAALKLLRDTTGAEG